MPVAQEAPSSPPKTLRISAALGTFSVVAVCLLAAAFLWFQGDWLDAFAVWIQHTQRTLHDMLAQTIRALEHGQAYAGWTLIAISLIYGVFHAAGPGHGKTVIATYLGGNPVLLRRGLVLSLLGAMLQGLTAILIVEVGRRLLDLSMPQVMRLGTTMEHVSYGFVALLGLVVLVRGALRLYRHAWPKESVPTRPAPADPSLKKGSLFNGTGKMQAYCAGCGVSHSLARHDLEQPLALRPALIAVLSIGLRPCTGALLVLLIAYSLDLRWAGIGAVLAMSLGTAAAVAALAAITVYARDGLLGLLSRLTGGTGYLPVVFAVAGMACGLLLMLLGASLLAQGLQTGVHPLLAPLGAGLR